MSCYVQDHTDGAEAKHVQLAVAYTKGRRRQTGDARCGLERSRASLYAVGASRGTEQAAGDKDGRQMHSARPRAPARGQGNCRASPQCTLQDWKWRSLHDCAAAKHCKQDRCQLARLVCVYYPASLYARIHFRVAARPCPTTIAARNVKCTVSGAACTAAAPA